MRNGKWLYACSLAIVSGMLCFTTVSCKDDDKKQEQGEVVETPAPVVEYYIMGTVTAQGVGMANVDVKVGSKTVKTDKSGNFSVTETEKGSYVIEVAKEGYLTQKTSVEIAATSENRSVVKVDLALTEQSKPTEVKADAKESVTVEDNSESNKDVKEPGKTEPEDVKEDMPLTKAEVTIPAGALAEDANISVTTYVPAPEAVAEVKPAEEDKPVEKSIPLAAVNFEPTGLKFEVPVTISIPNPIPGLTFASEDLQLTYLNKTTGKWEAQSNKVQLSGTSYQAPINHFSSYAVENKVNSTVSKEAVQKSEVLGTKTQDNSKSAKAVTGIVLKYTEKAGWDYEGDLVQIVKGKLAGASTETVNAMVAYLKTRMFSLMGSVSGVTSTERTYNTVNVNGFTKMNYSCYAKTRTTTLTANVIYNGSKVTIAVTAKRYTGADHQYSTVSDKHSGGQGGTN